MSDPSKPKKPDFDAGNLLALATLLVGLAGAWLYVAGRTYAYHYYAAYHLGLVGLGISPQDYFVFGAWALRFFPVWTFIWLLVTLAVAWGIRRWFGAGWMLAWLVLAVVVAFQLAFCAAPALAKNHVENDRASDYWMLPLVLIVVDPAWSTDNAGRERSAVLESGCYRLLIAGDQRLVLLRPFRDAPEVELVTLVLRWDAVRSLSLLPSGRSCTM
jgi:hypothetical protein